MQNGLQVSKAYYSIGYLVSLFNGMSTFVDYSMVNTLLYKNSIDTI